MKTSKIIPNDNYANAILLSIALLGVLLAFCRLFDNNFWGDECYSILLNEKGYLEIFTYEGENDVHPPLYHLISKFLCDVFGYADWVYHLSSFIPFTALIILTVTIFKKDFGFEPTLVLLICLVVMPSSVKYSVEVRM